MKDSSVKSHGPGTARFEAGGDATRGGGDSTRVDKAAALGHRESLVQPNVFVLQRRLKEIEQRTQRMEEMLSAVFLTLEEVRQAVGAGQEPGGPGFRLPPSPRLAPDRRYPWWQRIWFSFWDPERLRRPAVSRW